MPEIPIDENHQENPVERMDASIQLDRVKQKIMRLWETRVRKNVASAPSKSAPVLLNQLPQLLENLVSCISPRSSRLEIDEAGKIGKDHGEQRAALLDYTFPQVLHEYRILRQVIFEVLEKEKLQVSNVRDIILDVLDAGIEETQYIQAIRRSSARMTLLIDRLLEYSSVGREMKPFESVSTIQVVLNVVENLKAVIESSRAKLYFDELPVVLGDASLLSQLFQNFISNALKFRDLKRFLEIRIEAKKQGQSWLFSIRDNGMGFDPAQKEDIFSLFKRLESTKTQAGSGIGLATARKVVELHGGTVWAESQPGIGSIFFFTLPKSDDPVTVH